MTVAEEQKPLPPSYQHRRDPERHRAQVRASNRARRNAVNMLIAAHPVEFDRLHEAEAKKLGVRIKRKAADPKVIRAEIAELEAQLAKVTEQEQQEAVG